MDQIGYPCCLAVDHFKRRGYSSYHLRNCCTIEWLTRFIVRVSADDEVVRTKECRGKAAFRFYDCGV